eukprot:TRINITY_DN3270_c0_g2_i1.p1 TRINITY_DN3270_c0_g2~~TRINITY_DN3270_c0_g2_i1.p1  ORF type:complete len:336 (+),score=61.27 TRINITY_DN3270_c0_g2_i1:74-1081(+)
MTMGLNDTPYSEREDWKDVVPVPQDDGPLPLAAIRYPHGFVEVHDYFRAVQQMGEFGKRALHLTADVIEQNSANYTAWYYRRRCLKELSSDLFAELDFTDQWARDCPKNYQVWYHRRWLISEMAEDIKKKAGSPEEAQQQIREIADRELSYHADVMMVNEDYKNYNGWSHRHFIVSTFGVWDKEMQFVQELLVDDIRNNSAWNHKFTVLRNTEWPLTEEVRQREIDFTLDSIRKCANNEAAWNYLAAFFGKGEGKVPWESVPAVEATCLEILSLAEERESLCRFAVEAMARVYEAQGNVAKAKAQYMLLKDVDKIRANYWDWRCALLTETATAAA